MLCPSADSITPSGIPDDGESEVRLEVQTGSGQWRDAGPINLIDDLSNLNIACNPGTSNTNTAAKQPLQLNKDLPSSIIHYLRNNKYQYRNSPDGIDTNLLILFHGAGDTHEPYDKLAKQMQLPQTATLAVSARNVALPLDLGYTWFEEMDNVGNSLADDDTRRLTSLSRAVDWLEHLLCLLIGLDPNTGTDVDSSMLWIPERIFLLGFSAGACLAMEVCRSWRAQGRLALGGAICVAGGIKTRSSLGDSASKRKANNEATEILVVTGSNDETYSPQSATKSKQLYDSSSTSTVLIHIERGKGHSMIGSRSEMTAVMEFLAKRMVRRMTSMETMT